MDIAWRILLLRHRPATDRTRARCSQSQKPVLVLHWEIQQTATSTEFIAAFQRFPSLSYLMAGPAANEDPQFHHEDLAIYNQRAFVKSCFYRAKPEKLLPTGAGSNPRCGGGDLGGAGAWCEDQRSEILRSVEVYKLNWLQLRSASNYHRIPLYMLRFALIALFSNVKNYALPGRHTHAPSKNNPRRQLTHLP